MKIEDMIKNMNPQNLQNAMRQMEKMLTPEQMKQVQQTIQQTNKGELNRKLNHLSQADLQQELRQNPALAKQLANNPEIMKKINQIFQGK
ncbi:MAG: hypothetical protein U0L92_06170 [Clostridia bacterium]|nr:hypothetical protein [Clostridia bacterium]